MFQETVTLFNYHKQSGLWYPSVISGVDLIASKASTNTAVGTNNSDTVDIIINCTADKVIETNIGSKKYIGAKEYANCVDPTSCVTFTPECDFFFDGVWLDLTPINDNDYDEGLYHAINDSQDGVYMITSAAYFSMLPHFEIGGR